MGRFRSQSRTLVSVMVGLLVLAACGDDGSSGGLEVSDDGSGGDTDGQTLTEDEFVAQFSERCLEVDAELEMIPDPETFADVVSLGQEALSIQTEGLEDLRAIEPPEALATEVEAALSGLDVIVGMTGDLVAAAEAEDEASLESLVDEIDAAQQEVADQLTPLGIECGFESEGDTDGSNGEDETSSADPEQEFDQVTPADELPPGEPASGIAEFGSDPQFDDWAQQCQEGLMVACDALYLESDVGSGYEAYGDTCGGRLPVGGGPDNFCQQLDYNAAE